MRDCLFRKGLVVGIIFLFIGVGVYPAFAEDTKQSIVNNQSEDDCGCQVVNRYNLFRVKLLLVRLEVYINIILLRFGYIPEVAEKCQEILTKLNILSDDWPYYICKILYSINNLILETMAIFSDYGAIGFMFILMFLLPMCSLGNVSGTCMEDGRRSHG